MIDHISIGVRDLVKAAAFYDAVLAPLGFTRVRTRETRIGYGKAYPEFWINERPERVPDAASGLHVALRAADAAAVDAFHAAALAAGGRSDGMPGKRPEYTDRYYAAFIVDLDGNKIEAVTFLPAAS